MLCWRKVQLNTFLMHIKHNVNNLNMHIMHLNMHIKHNMKNLNILLVNGQEGSHLCEGSLSYFVLSRAKAW